MSSKSADRCAREVQIIEVTVALNQGGVSQEAGKESPRAPRLTVGSRPEKHRLYQNCSHPAAFMLGIELRA